MAFPFLVIVRSSALSWPWNTSVCACSLRAYTFNSKCPAYALFLCLLQGLYFHAPSMELTDNRDVPCASFHPVFLLLSDNSSRIQKNSRHCQITVRYYLLCTFAVYSYFTNCKNKCKQCQKKYAKSLRFMQFVLVSQPETVF